MAEKDGVGWVEFCFATQNKIQPIKEAKKSKIKKESSPFFDGLQGAFAFAKTPFHPSYTSCTMLLLFMQLPYGNNGTERFLFLEAPFKHKGQLRRVRRLNQ